MADEDIGMDSPRKKVAYDPDQDPEEKRVLRQKYRVLLKDEEGTKGVLSSGFANRHPQRWTGKDNRPARTFSVLIPFSRSPIECQ